jgi:hypothetical protein
LAEVVLYIFPIEKLGLSGLKCALACVEYFEMPVRRLKLRHSDRELVEEIGTLFPSKLVDRRNGLYGHGDSIALL